MAAGSREGQGTAQVQLDPWPLQTADPVPQRAAPPTRPSVSRFLLSEALVISKF